MMNQHLETSDALVKILVAEDSPTQAQHLRYVLERKGYEVLVAANGRIGLEMARAHRPALIISDVIMPEMDGYELSRAIKADPDLSDIPVILVTTMSDPQDVIRGLECGADNFVLKPYDEKYLLSRVRYVILNREMRRPHDVGMGVEIFFEGQRHFITADRLQILNLLLSTYDAAIQRNKELNRSQEELQGTNARLNDLTLELENRVRERTAELERSNAALRASEARLRLTIDTALDGVITMDADGQVCDWNPQAEAIFGWTREEAVGRPLHQLIIPERYRADHLRGVRRYLAEGRGTFLNRRLEIVGLRRDGAEIPVELSIAPMNHQRSLMFSGFVRDISERLATQNQLRELSRLNELILNTAAEGIIAVSRDGGLIFANPAASRLLEWLPGASIDDVHAVVHPRENDAECVLLANLRGATTSNSSETVFETASGKRLTVRYTLAPIIRDGEDSGAVLTFADMTEHKEMERRLEQGKRVASLGRVAATIAHEFNNVLMGIHPFAEVIHRRTDDEKIRHSAAQIKSSVTRGKRITDEILRFTQPSDPDLKPVVLQEWLSQTLPELKGLLGQRVALDVTLPQAPVGIKADPAQLQQVLANLVLNARDAIAGEGTIRICLSARSDSSAGGRLRPKAVLSVADTGAGMDKRVLEQVFDPLFTTKRNGTGLGLAVAQQVITAHAGTIRAESTPGVGTTFFIELPMTCDPPSRPDLGDLAAADKTL